MEEIQQLCTKTFSAENSQHRLKEKDIKNIITCFFICRNDFGKITADNEQRFINRWQHHCISNPLRVEPSMALKKTVHETRLQSELKMRNSDPSIMSNKVMFSNLTQKVTTSSSHKNILDDIKKQAKQMQKRLRNFIPDKQSKINHSDRFTRKEIPGSREL